MSEEWNELYQDIIMQHNRSPFHFEKRPGAGQVIEAYNPLCGDRFTLYLDWENGKIRQAHFHGYGCALSKASTSMLVQKLEGLSLEQVRSLIGRLHDWIDPERPLPEAGLEEDDLAVFASARRFPSRLTCATLSWEGLRSALDK